MIRINLLPVRAEKKKETLRQQAVLAGVLLLLLAGGVAVIHSWISSEILDLEQRIADRRAELSELQKKIGKVKGFEKKKLELKEKLDVISELESRQRGPVRVLDELARIIPEKMWIERLKDSKGSLSLEGVAIDNQTIAGFMTDLQASPWFGPVRLELTRQVTRGGLNLKSFSLKTSVVYGKSG